MLDGTISGVNGTGGGDHSLYQAYATGSFEGTVKCISERSGGCAYGFIDCEVTRATYGRDVFLHSTQASELELGARVRFDVQRNAKGMPQAHNVLRIG